MADLSNPCDSGCGNNVTANRPPTGADDPCNSSGMGYFCIGSVWTYDPTLPGADTGLNGGCQRSWIRVGDTCNNMADWLEIDVVDPTDVRVLVADTTIAQESIVVASLPTGIPGTPIGTNISLTVSNPSSCKEMAFFRNFDATLATISNSCGTGDAVVYIRGYWSNDGGATWTYVSRLGGPATVPVGSIVAIPIGGFSSAFVQAVGGTNQISFLFEAYNPDGNFCGEILIGSKTITALGTAI